MWVSVLTCVSLVMGCTRLVPCRVVNLTLVRLSRLAARRTRVATSCVLARLGDRHRVSCVQISVSGLGLLLFTSVLVNASSIRVTLLVGECMVAKGSCLLVLRWVCRLISTGLAAIVLSLLSTVMVLVPCLSRDRTRVCVRRFSRRDDVLGLCSVVLVFLQLLMSVPVKVSRNCVIGVVFVMLASLLKVVNFLDVPFVFTSV